MNYSSYSNMKNFFKASSGIVVILTMLISSVLMPLAASADLSVPTLTQSNLEGGGVFEFESSTDSSSSFEVSAGSESHSSISCDLWANVDEVEVGGSASLTWNTTGFTELKLNGQKITEFSGSKAFLNIQEDTVFTLVGTNDKGDRCEQTVRVGCIKPVTPTACELEVDKTVNKNFALIGDTLTYTIKVTNTGDADCTGDGVRIFDVVDPNVEYKSYSLDGDVSAGYDGQPVYTESDRMLKFNAHTLTPGESVSVSWTGVVDAPSSCGDFEVKNQAKATAKELGNFSDWSYSQTVKTSVEHDCVVRKCDDTEMWKAKAELLENKADSFTVKFTNPNDCEVELGATSYDVPVDSDGELCGWVNKNLDCQVRYGYKDIVLAANSEQTITVPKPNKCYQLDWYYGKSVETINYSGDPAHSYVGRLIDAVLNASVAECSTPKPLPPSCDLFESVPGEVLAGNKITLNWKTSYATAVFIDNGIGRVDETYGQDGSVDFTPLADTTFKMTVVGADDKEVYCEAPVKVTDDSKPYCEIFTATPSSLPVGGGIVSLDWKVVGATSVGISPAIGSVGLVGTRDLNVTESTTYTLTAKDADGDEVSCLAPVAVADPTPDPFTCSNNVTFTASDYSIDRGDDSELNWNVTDADSVSIDKIGASGLSGSETVSPSSDITYTLTAVKGSKTISCPLAIDVSTGGGGGGGGSSPRCDLEISDKVIDLGDTVTIRWDTSNATEVTLTDDRGEIIFTTDDYLASDKKEYYDDSIKVKPTRDTEYTLIAERGSRDRECSVDVKVRGDEDEPIVILESRNQQPLVAGISLTQVPYTGFEAGPIMTFFFYALLVVWALYISYLLIMRNRTVTPSGKTESYHQSETGISLMKQAESIRPDVFVQQVQSPSRGVNVVPSNLPVGNVAVVQDDDMSTKAEAVNPHQVDDNVVTNLENRAHQQRALLSSDAIRHFIGSTAGELEREEALDKVIADAKKTYPLEEGWIVINEQRMRNLCEECKVNNTSNEQVSFSPATVPEGTGSLAESIVTGNIVAAYQMIGSRPMFALADASSDLDAVYRRRKGGDDKVSDLLIKESEKYSDEQLKEAISALTSALDGTYNDEASAVKMAIMKAVKAFA